MKPIIRTLCLLLVCSFCTTAVISAQAELTKEEVKFWKTKAKEYRRNLPALKMLSESRDAAEQQVVDLQQEVNTLQTQVSLKDRQLAEFEAQVSTLNQRVVDAEMSAATPPSTVAPPKLPTMDTSLPSITGTLFRIQIAAMSKKKLEAELASGNSMMLMEDGSGMQKVMVGEFRSYLSARALRDKLRQIGVKGAFIQAFQDGQPIDVKTAVQYTGEEMD